MKGTLAHANAENSSRNRKRSTAKLDSFQQHVTEESLKASRPEYLHSRFHKQLRSNFRVFPVNFRCTLLALIADNAYLGGND